MVEHAFITPGEPSGPRLGPRLRLGPSLGPRAPPDVMNAIDCQQYL